MNTMSFVKTLFLFALLLLSSCATATPAQPAIPPSAPVPNSQPPANNLPESDPTFAAGPETPALTPPISVESLPSEPLYLRVLWPEDGSLISTPEIELVGEAPPGTVISINDEILIVPANGTFRQAINLEEGPNAIELVASNQAGEEQTLILILVYEP